MRIFGKRHLASEICQRKFGCVKGAYNHQCFVKICAIKTVHVNFFILANFFPVWNQPKLVMFVEQAGTIGTTYASAPPTLCLDQYTTIAIAEDTFYSPSTFHPV